VVYTGIAYRKSLKTQVLTELDPIADPHLRYEGTKFFVPALNKLVGILCFSDSPRSAYIESPTIRSKFPYFLEHIGDSIPPVAKEDFIDRFENPLELTVDEPLIVKASVEDTATEHDVVAVLLLGDGDLSRPEGEILVVKGSVSVSAEAFTWANGQISFAETLPAGRYALVGAVPVASNLIGVRFLFQGHPWRPFIPGVQSLAHRQHDRFLGNCGVLGEFDARSPPSVDVLASSSLTSVDIYMYLIKLA